MRIFLCWSGRVSHQIAIAMRDFLGDAIQELKPFLSSEDVRKGARWRTDIGQQLAETNFGILCLTKDNLAAPWILFEAGALSKNLVEGRVTALLAGIQATDVIEPLSQFQHTKADRDEVLKLLQDINQLLPEEKRRTQDQVERAFAAYWSRFKDKFDQAMEMGAATPAPTRTVPDIVSETLELVREMKREQDASLSWLSTTTTSLPTSLYTLDALSNLNSDGSAGTPLTLKTLLQPASTPDATPAGPRPAPVQQPAKRVRLIRVTHNKPNKSESKT